MSHYIYIYIYIYICSTVAAHTYHDRFSVCFSPFPSLPLSRTVRDVLCESVDLSYGSVQLVMNSQMRLVFGRKYALVGRNGAGKSTLLRHIADREVRPFFACSISLGFNFFGFSIFFWFFFISNLFLSALEIIDINE